MPIVTIAMYSGRTQTEKDRLAEMITEDVAKILMVPKKRSHHSLPGSTPWQLVFVRRPTIVPVCYCVDGIRKHSIISLLHSMVENPSVAVIAFSLE